MIFGMELPELNYVPEATLPLTSALSGWSGRGFPGCQDPSHDWSVELVLALGYGAGVVFCAKDENGQDSFFLKGFFCDCHGQNPVETVLAVGGLVAMLAGVPGKDANLIVVVGQAVVGIGKQAKVLRDLLLHTFVAVGHLVQYEESDETLP